MRKTLVSSGVFVVFFIFVLLSDCARDLSEYDVLMQPQINTIPEQKMIAIEVKGDPNEVAGVAFKALYKMYFRLKKDVKDLEMKVAPRARWPISFDTPKSEWEGIFGLPIPEAVNELPEIGEDLPEVKIDYWEYGEVAEILHIGPYSEETTTIEKLHKFIADRGYEISGYHEEEYLKGPGMFGKGNPKKYKTIIRYPVEKK